jgi:predicted nucleic acid-binding protein
MKAVVPDTSVWVTLIRQGVPEGMVRRSIRGGSIRLTSIVAQELYAGAASAGDKGDLDRIRQSFVSAGLTLTPTFDDWCAAGTMIERYGRLHGRVNPRDHLNDVLIVLSAAQVGATVLTWNVGDMRRWNRMLPANRRVSVQKPLLES